MRNILIVSVAALGLLQACNTGNADPNATFVPEVTVTPPANSAPTVSSANTDQQSPIGHQFDYDATKGGTTFTDANGDALSYTVTLTPDNGDYTVTNGVISGIATAPGTVTVSITATDGTDTSPADEFEINCDYQQSALQAEFGSGFDLAALPNYANPTVPAYIGDANTVTNPVTDPGATLGRILFYDPALSIDDTVSCASCHQQANAFSDLATVSAGVDGGVTGRHSMRLINTIYSDEPAFFWDERAADLEDQVTQPIRDENEHGFSGQNGRQDFNDLTNKLAALPYYQEMFAFAFTTPEVTEARMQSALSQFVNSIVSFDSRFDEGRDQVTNPFDQFPNFTADENAGKLLYMSGTEDDGAACRRCHADPQFDIFAASGHIGVIGVAGDPTATDMTNTRSPSLRDLFKPDGTTNGPFMHDGSMATMREVIDHYDNIPVPTTEPLRTEFLDTLDPQLLMGGLPEPLGLTETEKQQLEAFLLTLSGTNVYTDPKWSDPF